MTDLVSDSDSVLWQCKDFYQNLYREDADDHLHMEDIDDLIDVVYLPALSDTERAFMDSAFTQEEFKLALDNLNKNRCPCSDGLPPEFYCHFWEHLAPFLFDSLFFPLQKASFPLNKRGVSLPLSPRKMLTVVWSPTGGL